MPPGESLLATIGREQLAQLFASSKVSLSLAQFHDGTPNTLLEAMACGCFPVAGDVDSLREWMANGENGLICDHTDAKSLASCVVRALEDDSMRVNAAKTNRELIRTRGSHGNVMTEAETLYAEVQRASSRASLRASAP